MPNAGGAARAAVLDAGHGRAARVAPGATPDVATRMRAILLGAKAAQLVARVTSTEAMAALGAAVGQPPDNATGPGGRAQPGRAALGVKDAAAPERVRGYRCRVACAGVGRCHVKRAGKLQNSMFNIMRN